MPAKSTQQWHRIAQLIKHTYDIHGRTLPDDWYKIAAKRIYVTYIKPLHHEIYDMKKE